MKNPLIFSTLKIVHLKILTTIEITIWLLLSGSYEIKSASVCNILGSAQEQHLLAEKPQHFFSVMKVLILIWMAQVWEVFPSHISHAYMPSKLLAV